jgi:hypothetical protein
MHREIGPHAFAHPQDGALNHFIQIDRHARLSVHRREALESVDDVGVSMNGLPDWMVNMPSSLSGGLPSTARM